MYFLESYFEDVDKENEITDWNKIFFCLIVNSAQYSLIDQNEILFL